MKYLLILIAITLFSCQTVHKIFDKHKEHLDSTTVTHDVSIDQKHIDTTKVTEVKQGQENSVEIDLESPVDTVDRYWRKGGRWAIINDSPVKHDYYIKVDRKTGKIISNQPITHVTIKASDYATISNFTGGIDSSVLTQIENDSTHVKKTEENTHQTIDKKGMGFWPKVAIIGGLILAFVIYFIILYIKKKKKTVSDVVQAAKDIL